MPFLPLGHMWSLVADVVSFPVAAIFGMLFLVVLGHQMYFGLIQLLPRWFPRCLARRS